MAMTKCKECGADISTEAAACPKCGAKAPKRTSALVKVLAVVLIPSCVAGIWASNKATTERAEQTAVAEAAKTPEQRAAEAAAKQKQEAEFQRAVQFARVLKSSMKNPASFELADATRTADGAVCIEYRGTNSFNAVVPSYGVMPPDGKPVAGAESTVAAAWNKHCANKQSTSLKHIARAM